MHFENGSLKYYTNTKKYRKYDLKTKRDGVTSKYAAKKARFGLSLPFHEKWRDRLWGGLNSHDAPWCARRGLCDV
jgi:hypothetical protein